MAADNSVGIKLDLDFQGVNDALYQMIGQFNGTDKEFQKIANNIEKNAKNLEGAIKLFGPASQQAGAAAKKLEKDFQSLVANGIEPASASFKQLTTSMPKSAGLDSTTGSLRKNNQQWSNLALVIQDLPFGFRGIQNNLPALAGGFAKMTGPIFLAISAIIALITAWDMGLFKLKKSTDSLTEANKEYAESLKETAGSAGEEIAKVNALVSIAKDQEESMDKRLIAVKKLQDEYPSYFGNLSQEKILNGDIKTSVDGVKTAILERAKATAQAGKINKLSAEKFAKEEELYQLALIKTARIKRALAAAAATNVPEDRIGPLLQLVVKDVRLQENTIQSAVDKIDVELTRLEEGYKKTTSAFLGLEDETGKGGAKPKVSTSRLDALKSQQKAYKDDIEMFYTYGNLIIDEEERIAKARAKINGTLSTELKDIEENFESQRIVNKQDFGRKIMEEADKNTKALEKIEKESQDKILENTKSYYDNRKKYAFDNLEEQKVILNQELAGYKFLLDLKVIDDIAYANKAAQIYKDLGVIKNKEEENLYKSQVYFSNQRIKNIQSKLAIELKIHRNNIGAQKEAIKKSMAEVGALAYSTFNPEALQKLLDFFNELDGKLKGTKEQWQSFSQGISNSISGFLADSFTSLAENIGNALSGGEIKPLEHFQKLLADALINIGKMLIQYGTLLQIAFASPDPFVAIAAGVGAVALGTIIKNRLKQSAVDPTAFANGGIVSGPTMGLMGEYPGAQNNPEVIAPLDKLKDLIGGGGNGQFVLRGQDLVLAMQRSNSSLNIRRG
jgi:hypothetical protein